MAANSQPNLPMARAAGLRVREQDIDAVTLWGAERAQALALPQAAQYCELLASDSAAGRRERELLTVRCSTGESYFFRDEGQFDLLARTILPALIERRAKERRLRIWSAGCAAGEEAYSLAMLVDALMPGLSGWDVLILGTDINSAALEKARRGMYGDWSFRALGEARKQRYFRRSGSRWQIVQRLRDMVSFRSGDLVWDRIPDTAGGLCDFDLILCRNVFIYLDTHAVARISAKFAAALAGGGFLVTGHSELFGHSTAPLCVRMYAQSAVYEKTEHAAEAADVAAAAPPLQAAPAEATGRQTPVPNREQGATPAPALRAPVEDCEQLLQAAWRQADRGAPEAAEHACREAIALGGLDPRPYYLLAQLAQERGELAQAKTLLKKVIYLDPSCVPAYLELGGLYAQAGDSVRACRMYETARAALLRLPATAAIAPYSESPAGEILAYVERLLVPLRTHAGAAAQTALQQGG